jgi:hypothetical protein
LSPARANDRPTRCNVSAIVEKLERTIHCIRYLIANVAEEDVRAALVVNADIVSGLITVAREKLEQPAKLRSC